MNQKRWIVNAAERSVREQSFEDDPKRIMKRPEDLQPGEFFWTGAYADAMAAGARRRLAEEALGTACPVRFRPVFAIVADRIEPQEASGQGADEAAYELREILQDRGFDVWREGSGLVVLGRLPS